MTRKRFLRWALAIFAAWLLIWALPRLGLIYTDLLWFQEVGYSIVFWRTLSAKVYVGLIFGLFFFVVVYGNVWLAQRLAPRAAWYEFESRTRLEIAYELERFLDRWLGRIAFIVCALFAYSMAKHAAGRWMSALVAFNPTPFGRTDPVMGRDLSFYVFQLPFLEFVQNQVAVVLFAALVLSAGVHYLGKAIRTVGGIPAFAPHVKVHLSVLVAALLLVKAWDYRLQAYKLLLSPRGAVFGATYTDIHASLFFLTILFVVAIVCAVLVMANLRFRGFVLPIIAIIVLMIFSVIGGLYPAAVQRYQVDPSEQTVEAPYIERNIAATRFAFNIEGIQDVTFPALKSITPQTLRQEQATIQNIRLWDHRPLLDAYMQKQQLQPYYRFSDVDIDRYHINGDYRQVMLSAREISIDHLPSRNWQNDHMFYTHGYGVVLSPVNEATRVGEPKLMVRDIPPVSTALPEITRPEIYYGEIAKSRHFSLVNTSLQEVDYPLTGQKTARTTYAGDGGIPLGGSFRRLLMSLRFGLIDFILSKNMTADTKIIFKRSVFDRLRTIAPFLHYDYDPYIVISEEGRLYWIQDAYTISRQMPYSQPYQLYPGRGSASVNYIRNSVKILIDAYNGTTEFFIADPEDPLVGTLGKVFPGLFKPLEEMPEGLRAHLRYPEELFHLQARVLATYHMQDVEQFYNRADKWQLATEKAGKQTTLESPFSGAAAPSGEEVMEAYFTLMRLPGEEKEEFILMIPFTPLERQNMVAWMAARCDPEHYGELITYEFSRAQQVYGPAQFEGVMDQDSEISKLFTLWGQRGSDVVRGNLLVIPLGEAVLYVEPIFLKADVGAIPQLKLVVVGRQEGEEMRVFFAPTLNHALAIATGQAPQLSAEDLLQGQFTEAAAAMAAAPAALPAEPGAPEVGPPAPTSAADAELRKQASQALAHYRRAQRRLRAGDLAGFEEELGKMEEVLQKMGRD